VDVSTPMESTSTKISLHVNRFAESTVNLEMVMGGWTPEIMNLEIAMDISLLFHYIDSILDRQHVKLG
jgi:hypothetical protein